MNGTPAGLQRGDGVQERKEQQQEDTDPETHWRDTRGIFRAHSFARTTRHARHGHGTGFPGLSMTFSQPPTVKKTAYGMCRACVICTSSSNEDSLQVLTKLHMFGLGVGNRSVRGKFKFTSTHCRRNCPWHEIHQNSS